VNDRTLEIHLKPLGAKRDEKHGGDIVKEVIGWRCWPGGAGKLCLFGSSVERLNWEDCEVDGAMCLVMLDVFDAFDPFDSFDSFDIPRVPHFWKSFSLCISGDKLPCCDWPMTAGRSWWGIPRRKFDSGSLAPLLFRSVHDSIHSFHSFQLNADALRRNLAG
jgi:hypothetical protein